MELGRIEPVRSWTDFVIVRMVRRWVAAKEAGTDPLPSLAELATELGLEVQVAIALHSLFQLTEHCLGRRLRAECCCNRSLDPDERAVLALVDAAPVQGPWQANRALPHGLPAALCWAVASTRLALGITEVSMTLRPPSARCPFETQTGDAHLPAA